MYDQHGSHHLTCDGDVLIMHGRGPWNEEAIRNYRRDLEKAIATLPPRWAFIGEFHGEAVLIPEAEREVEAVVAWRRTKGMAAMAIVMSDVTAKGVAFAQLARIYDNAGVAYRVFDNEAQALDWLASEGFRTASRGAQAAVADGGGE